MGIKGTVSNTSGFSEEINPINNALIKGDALLRLVTQEMKRASYGISL